MQNLSKEMNFLVMWELPCFSLLSLLDLSKPNKSASHTQCSHHLSACLQQDIINLPPKKTKKKKKRKKPLSCFTTQHPNRVASSLALPSSPHINLSVCTVGHPLAVLVSDSNIYRKTMLAGLTGSQHSLVVPRFFLIPGTTRDDANAGWFTPNEPCDD